MPVFSYTALDVGAREVAGTLTAQTPAEGRQRLRDQDLRVLQFSLAEAGKLRLRLGLGGRQRRQEQVAEMARYLSLLLHAGVPLAESLEVLAHGGAHGLTTILKDVRDRVTGGEGLAEALAVHERWFDRLFIDAVRVGELSGNLEEALADLADHLQARERLRGQLTSALAYPIILVCLGVAVVIFLMSYVIPQLLTVLAASGRPLPASTAVLKSLSDLLVGHWLGLLMGFTAVGLAAGFAYRSEAGKRTWHRLQLQLPLVGPLLRKSVVAQFAQQMALLLRTGTPFVEAARSVATLTRNLVLADELTVIARAVESGSDIAPAMANSRVFPPVVVRLVAIGQDSGELTALLTELRNRYDAEVRLATTRFTTLLEPLLIVGLAAVVGFVVFACLMPILEATRGIA